VEERNGGRSCPKYAESIGTAGLVLGEAVFTAVYLLNRAPCKAMDGGKMLFKSGMEGDLQFIT
jgi:hypothetical protein